MHSRRMRQLDRRHRVRAAGGRRSYGDRRRSKTGRLGYELCTYGVLCRGVETALTTKKLLTHGAHCVRRYRRRVPNGMRHGRNKVNRTAYIDGRAIPKKSVNSWLFGAGGHRTRFVCVLTTRNHGHHPVRSNTYKKLWRFDGDGTPGCVSQSEHAVFEKNAKTAEQRRRDGGGTPATVG